MRPIPIGTTEARDNGSGHYFDGMTVGNVVDPLVAHGNGNKSPLDVLDWPIHCHEY